MFNENSFYSNETSFISDFEDSLSSNNTQLNIALEKDILRITTSFNNLYQLMSNYINCFEITHINQISPVNKILFSAYHKSTVNLATSFYLTKHGLWGACRSLIRQVFEFLIIAKYSSIENEFKIFDLWIKGEQITVSKAVFNKLLHPLPDIFKEFWGLTSDYSHATIYSSQVSFELKSNVHEFRLNFVYIEMMLECQFHLLISHIVTPSINYYLKAYGEDRYNKIIELKKLLNNNFQDSKINMEVNAKKLVKDYRSKWILK